MAKDKKKLGPFECAIGAFAVPVLYVEERIKQWEQLLKDRVLVASTCHVGVILMDDDTSRSLGQTILDRNPSFLDGSRTLILGHSGKPASHVYTFYKTNLSGRTRFEFWPYPLKNDGSYA